VSKVGGVTKKRGIPPKRAVSPELPLQKSAMLQAMDKLNGVSQIAASLAVNNSDMYDHYGEFVAGFLRKAGDQKAIIMTKEISNILMKHMTAFHLLLQPQQHPLISRTPDLQQIPMIHHIKPLFNSTADETHKTTNKWTGSLL
jgi:hypothetical protein